MSVNDARLTWHIRRVFHTIDLAVNMDMIEHEELKTELERVGTKHLKHDVKGVEFIVSEVV